MAKLLDFNKYKKSKETTYSADAKPLKENGSYKNLSTLFQKVIGPMCKDIAEYAEYTESKYKGIIRL